MKKIWYILLIMLTLSACSSQTVIPADTENTQAENVTMLDEGAGPVNTYTDGLPIPPGTVSWAVLDTEHENCSISLVDLNETDYDNYMELLKQEGFFVIGDTSEEIKGENYISIGTILSNGEKGLSISYIPNNFTIYISFVE